MTNEISRPIELEEGVLWTGPPTLAAALAELQTQMPDIPHNQTANAGTYSYTYADLKSTTEALYPLMGPLGLSFTARGVVLDDGRFVLRCSLLHVSGEREEGDYPLKADQRHQDLGSAISYGRRYMFCALTGAVTEKDDDGQRADGERPAKRVSRSKKKAEPDQWSTPPPDEPVQPDTPPRKVTDGQVVAIQAGFRDIGYSASEEDRTARLIVISGLVGHPVDSVNDLDVREAAQVIDAIEQKKRERVIE